MTRVLYVEHDDDNLYMLKMRLERVDDFEVLTVGDSERGCELAVTEHPDVILMDLEMPDADCWEVVRGLKKDAQTGHIPIIGISAYALDSEREKAIASGCDELGGAAAWPIANWHCLSWGVPLSAKIVGQRHQPNGRFS